MSFTDIFNIDHPSQSSQHDDNELPNVHCDWRNYPDLETGNVVNNDTSLFRMTMQLATINKDVIQRGQPQNRDTFTII